MTAPGAAASCRATLPVVLHVAFGGPRRLWQHLPADQPELHAQLRAELKAQLAALPAAVGLEGGAAFATGLSQMAIGADTLFSELLAELQWTQRVLLPQPRAEFLAAVGSRGPDFTPEQAAHASTLLDSPHVIEESVVSCAGTRHERFEDVNLRLLDEADLVVCLHVESTGPDKPGGTTDLAQRARRRGLPVLELSLQQPVAGQPLLRASWLAGGPPGLAPALPSCLNVCSPPAGAGSGNALPALNSYLDVVKSAASAQAGRRRTGFTRDAAVVVLTHVVATVLALMAMKLPPQGWTMPLLLAALATELGLLGWGFLTHKRLHDERATREWAMARLCAELARSVRSCAGLPGPLQHLRELAFPPELQPLARSLNVLHLAAIRAAPNADLQGFKDRYVQQRLSDPHSGQQPYFERAFSQAQTSLKWASWVFTALSGAAFVATLYKLGVVATHTQGPWASMKDWAGPLAIALPVMAAGAMSLATALDWDARAHTFFDMHSFCSTQANHIQASSSMREAARLVLHTEQRLLGEALNWFGRRAYVGVA